MTALQRRARATDVPRLGYGAGADGRTAGQTREHHGSHRPYGFRTTPGKLADHLAGAAEGLGHLRRLGLQAVNLQAIAGTDVGVIATSVNHASNADYAAGMQKVLADEQWQEFWMRVNSDAAAVEVESSLFVDIDATFQPSADRALGVVLATQWRAFRGG